MIKDVSKQWAMLMESEESEDQKYAEACDEACKEIKKIEEEEIDGYDAEEVDPCECGFAECEVQVDEVVDPLKMWQDLKKDTKPVEVRVDADYISKIQKMFGKFKSAKPKVYAQVMKKLDEYRKNGTKLPPPEDFIENFIPFDEIQRSGEDSYSDTDNVFGNKDAEENLWDSMNEEQQADVKKQVSDGFKSAKNEVKTATRQEVKEFLKSSKGAIEDAQRKINDQQLNGNIAKITEFLEKYADGKIQDNEGNQALGESAKPGFWSPVAALAKGCLRFLVWMLRLTGLAVFGTGWLIKLMGKVAADLCAKLDQSLAECQIMECDGEDDEELDETGCAVKKECGDEDGKEKKGQIEEADDREAVSHLLDPVGVKASTASLKAQDTAALSIVEKLLTKIEKLEQRLEESESRAEKNSAEAASSKSAVDEAETVNDIKTIDKWYAHLMKACCSVPEDPKLIEALLKIIKQVEKNLQQEYIKPGDWEKFTVLWKDHFCAEDLLNYFTQTSNQYGLVLLTQMNPAAFIDGKTDYKKAIKDFQNKTADCRRFLVDKAKNVQTITTKLSEGEGKWSKMSIEEQEDEELKGWGLSDDQIAVLDAVNKIEENPDVKRHLTPDEVKKFKFYRELSFKRELNDKEKKDFIELVKGVDSEEIFDIIDQMEGNSFFGKSELFNYRDSWEDRKRIHSLEKKITRLTDEVRMGKFNSDADKEKDAMDKIKALADELKKLDPSNSMVKDVEKMEDAQKVPAKGQDTWKVEEWNSFLSSASKKQREDLMNELIDDIEKRYPDKTDKESQKKKSEEMMYVWKLFKHDATTREFGRAFNSSHAGAGKYINTTVDMWRDAIKLLCKQENLRFDSSTFKDILGDNRLFAKLKYILGEQSRTRRKNKITIKEVGK